MVIKVVKVVASGRLGKKGTDQNLACPGRQKDQLDRQRERVGSFFGEDKEKAQSTRKERKGVAAGHASFQGRRSMKDRLVQKGAS